MALQVSYQTQFGITIDKAYCKIISFTGDKTNIKTDVVIYANQEVKELGYQAIGFTSLTLDLAYGATMQEMYDALKLQEPFINAIAV